VVRRVRCVSVRCGRPEFKSKRRRNFFCLFEAV